MTPTLYLAQRLSAVILAAAVLVHIATVVYAAQGGLTAGEILARTKGNTGFFAFYTTFALAAAVHAPIGLRSVLREWTDWRGRSLDIALTAFACLIAVMGVRVAVGVYAA